MLQSAYTYAKAKLIVWEMTDLLVLDLVDKRLVTNLNKYTCSTKLIIDAVMELFERIVDKNLLIRRINISANNVVDKESIEKKIILNNLISLQTIREYKRKKRKKKLNF